MVWARFDSSEYVSLFLALRSPFEFSFASPVAACEQRLTPVCIHAVCEFLALAVSP